MSHSFLPLIAAGDLGAALADVFSSSFMGLFVYGTLFLFSISSWGIMIKKIVDLYTERRKAKEFRRRFLDMEGNIVLLSQAGIVPANSPARLFVSAYEELRLWATLDRERNCIIAERPVVSALERTLDRAIEMEKERWERGTTLLATIASLAPLLGLLGTVWGVYMAFKQMSVSDTATLSTVGRGMSEALLTTVAGLLVAIPAVFGHNAILRAIRSIETDLENFANEIVNHFDRQIVVGTIVQPSEPPSAFSGQPLRQAIKRRPRGIS